MKKTLFPKGDFRKVVRGAKRHCEQSEAMTEYYSAGNGMWQMCDHTEKYYLPYICRRNQSVKIKVSDFKKTCEGRPVAGNTGDGAGEKFPLFGRTMPELSAVVEELSLPGFAARQIAAWLYGKNVSSVDEMTDLSLKARTLLSEKYGVGVGGPLAETMSVDGTKKYLFAVSGGARAEAAFIPDRDRATLCISSQAGCRMGCVFCMTGRQGLRGNLTAGDILNQFRSLPERDRLTNIVFMGMGEPFDNTDEVMKALEILTADYGYAWAPKRITVSTVGIIPAVRRFMNETRCHLAVSLHHPDPAERKRLMPVENKYPVRRVIDLLKTYDLNRQRRISFEYVMLAGVNDSPSRAADVVRLLSGLRCRVNLIRFHAIPGSGFVPSSDAVIRQFAELLNKKGVIATIRQSRGRDIDAACGMLSAGYGNT